MKMSDEVVIRLSNDEFQALILLLGHCTGTAMKEQNLQRAYMAMQLANAVNRTNPRWTPYVLGEKEKTLS